MTRISGYFAIYKVFDLIHHRGKLWLFQRLLVQLAVLRDKLQKLEVCKTVYEEMHNVTSQEFVNFKMLQAISDKE
jgi:hypothetical protein